MNGDLVYEYISKCFEVTLYILFQNIIKRR